MHEKLLHFVGGSRWSDAAIRLEATRHVCRLLAQHEKVTTWVVDDTGFLEAGKHSVGVHRQYTGTAGKVNNRQSGVSLEIATASQHAPIDFELYLPEGWVNDRERRAKARIPEEVTFKTKIELALGMIERAVRAKVPGEIILADSAYGGSSAKSPSQAQGLHSPPQAPTIRPRSIHPRPRAHSRLGPTATASSDPATAATTH